MILEEALNEVVRDIINTVLGIPGFAIKAKDNGPRPTGSYAAVDFLSDISIGWEQNTIVNSGLDVQQTSEGARQIVLPLSFYRENAIDNARKVRTSFVRDSVYLTLYSANLGLVDRSMVRETSEVLESAWEESAQFDLTLSAVGTDAEIVMSIMSLDIDSDFQTRGESIPINIEVNT